LNYTAALIAEFEKNSNSSHALGMKAYMLNQFEFYGIKTPLRDFIVKNFLKENRITHYNELEKVIKELWNMDKRELQYAAIDIFTAHKDLWKLSSIKLIQYCITEKSWWETVDSIASDWLGLYFRLFPELTISTTKGWNQSNNIWLQRSSILFQKAAKKNTDTTLLSTYILNLSHSKDFFVQKAIGWALREFGKTNPDWVINFVKANELAPLSIREALKRIK
jgi:3-methyladenine DNA glycosylase AlkD